VPFAILNPDKHSFNAHDLGLHQSSFSGPNSEYGVLQEVILASPRFLTIVPCNRVSEEALEAGCSSCSVTAREQHRKLADTLSSLNVKVRTVKPHSGLPDLAFTRDTTLVTPWGMIGLRPGAAHRRDEVDVVLEEARLGGVPVLGRVAKGKVEGGDVCMIRPGHLVIGVSGDRTDVMGANALGSLFEQRGWEVRLTPVDPDLLHLDTHFCMIDRDLALGCIEKLGQPLLQLVEQLGIEIRPDEIPTLGANVLSLGGRRVVSCGSAPRIDNEMRARGVEVHAVALDEFTQCGGGVHCLTMPLRRRATRP
jgi:N-dimethylarginine dimethylaminohydrolase